MRLRFPLRNAIMRIEKSQLDTGEQTMPKTRKMTADETRFAKNINRCGKGDSTSHPKYGRVTCCTCKASPRRFSVSKSKVAQNRGNYTYSQVLEAFGLR